MLQYSAEPLENIVRVSDYVRDYVDVPRFLECCRACPNYDTKWSCPPYGFDPLSLWMRFSELRIFGSKLTIENGAEESGWDVWDEDSEPNRVIAAEKQKLIGRALALEEEYEGSMALFAGSCALCGECARKSGAPCRRPGLMRYSIEALGGNVADTAEKLLGVPIQWSAGGRVPEYFVLVCGLLVR